ncbi:uncharacterized protein LOC119596184, partial [Penaeus monodon]|uniref:uncharacterized protein LOC119596184 n=1 Tax=Penaeus monodon TaxID=6687 RepID=UPI0018A7838C
FQFTLPPSYYYHIIFISSLFILLAPPSPKADVEVRLVGGPADEGGRVSAGRVEVRYLGIWGTVCDDDFSLEEGHVICRMLDWEGAAFVYKNNSFGPGEGQVWLDDVRCLGYESSVADCQHLPWGQNNCDHTEDVGLLCSNTPATASVGSGLVDPSDNSVPDLPSLPLTCGRREVEDTPTAPMERPKVVSGHTPPPGAHPWMVAIKVRTKTGPSQWCGGAILGEDHILTAAHCVYKYPASTYILKVGDYNSHEEEEGEQQFGVSSMTLHPQFDKGPYLNNDIAILTVKRKDGKGIRFGRYVQPLCLVPPGWKYPSYLNCTVAGWGSLGPELVQSVKHKNRRGQPSLGCLLLAAATARKGENHLMIHLCFKEHRKQVFVSSSPHPLTLVLLVVVNVAHYIKMDGVFASSTVTVYKLQQFRPPIMSPLKSGVKFPTSISAFVLNQTTVNILSSFSLHLGPHTSVALLPHTTAGKGAIHSLLQSYSQAKTGLLNVPCTGGCNDVEMLNTCHTTGEGAIYSLIQSHSQAKEQAIATWDREQRPFSWNLLRLEFIQQVLRYKSAKTIFNNVKSGITNRLADTNKKQTTKEEPNRFELRLLFKISRKFRRVHKLSRPYSVNVSLRGKNGIRAMDAECSDRVEYEEERGIGRE